MSASSTDFNPHPIAKSEPGSARYAIYFVPAADSSLYRFGTEFMGYDCYSGALATKPSWCGLPEVEWRQLTTEPRKYGFHATLKAPFRLAPSLSIEELISSTEKFSRSLTTISSLELSVQRLGPFIALTDPARDIRQLADASVRELDRFRAPLTSEEKSRRAASGLTARQAENVERWGYPYVFEDFCFHMTLTGPAAQTAVDPLLKQLRESFSQQVDPSGCMLDRISLVSQDSPASAFRVLRSWQLSNA